MINNDGVAGSALTGGPADALAELGVGVRGEELKGGSQRCQVFMRRGRESHDELVLDAVGLAPGRHDEGVVVGNDDDLVNALGLELVGVVDVRGDVGGRAGGREGAGHGDEDDLLLLELCGGGV